MNDANSTALRLSKIVMTFGQGAEQLSILRGADCAVRAGELVALVGPSGAGKSTLLHIAGLLERPTDGDIEIAGLKANGLDDGARTGLRRKSIGFVYQFHRLLPEFSALENIVVPQMIAGVPRKAAGERALALLDRVGLAQRADHRPGKLSGGEQQRVAIVRALANAPRVLIGDEPTGNLDHHTADDVMNALISIVRTVGLGALIATHNIELARRMDRIVTLEDGVLVERS